MKIQTIPSGKTPCTAAMQNGVGKETEILEVVRQGRKKAICVVRARQERTGILYTDQRRMKKPEDILAAFGRLFERAGVEQLVAVALTQTGEPVAIQLIAVGGVNSCMVSVAEVLKLALLSNTPSILLLHNHPSGSIRPSEEDRGITERVKTAAEIVGVHLVDHIIVGNMRHGYSILGEQEIYLSEMEKDQATETA